jgi:hypothetical protein
LPDTIDYLLAIHFLSILLTILTALSGFPAALSPLLKLLALASDDLLFSDDDWPAFFLAVRLLNVGGGIGRSES